VAHTHTQRFKKNSGITFFSLFFFSVSSLDPIVTPSWASTLVGKDAKVSVSFGRITSKGRKEEEEGGGSDLQVYIYCLII
jgi:hypothetical protein